MGVRYPITVPERCPFTLQNIPFGIFSLEDTQDQESTLRAGSAIGDFVLDLHTLAQYGGFEAVGISRSSVNVFSGPNLNSFAALPAADRARVRLLIIDLLSQSESMLFQNAELNNKAFILKDHVTMHVPMAITDYSDSFGSLIHANNTLGPFGFPMPQSWFHYPMAYNGRTGGVEVSGNDIIRPSGLFPDPITGKVILQPSRQLDFEIGIGMFVGKPVEKGETITAQEASDHIFGLVLHNDWSARDHQKFEMAPLGVFHSKSFSTSISPWVVTLDALQACVAPPPPSNLTEIHPMLRCDDKNTGMFDVDLPATVSRNGGLGVEITRSNHKDEYWSLTQMLAYHSLNGCGLKTGDLISTGTISSPQHDSRAQYRGPATNGCLTEVFALGNTLPEVGGKPMSWLEDGDRLTIEGWFRARDGTQAGFGPLTSLIRPAQCW
ncbi:fumarylacetoacetase [Exophiala mesophila]|uniref:Fumarylacetoacetase n=1 Tax=Exophiala mesophila TaxID=212818 RepID=A0A0D1XWP3_EXOME|nr:fumarylacetoacetase [Exophiala mesophila]KIV92636.1 fumarylacetoacetase [Exophiala mesophila]